MPKVKEMADVLGVSPQAVRDFAKKELGITPEARKAIVFTTEQAQIIANYFKKDNFLQSLEADLKAEKAKEETTQPQLPFFNEGNAEIAALRATIEGKDAEIRRLEEQVSQLRERIEELRAEKDELKEENTKQLNELKELYRQPRGGFWRRLLGSGKKSGE